MQDESQGDHWLDRLTDEDKNYLLSLARQALEDGVKGDPIPPIDIDNLPSILVQPGATFVTLTIDSELRGCIGSLEATRPLAEDVRLHAVAAALEDYRFPPVQEEELSRILIEISRLTIPKLLQYNDPEELLSKIRPGLDGVILKEGIRRATFLPQVWKKVPEAEVFLSMLCRKMGAPSSYWRSEDVEIFVYQVEEFHE
jgi:AmmeMemoRadiSam system protein A